MYVVSISFYFWLPLSWEIWEDLLTAKSSVELRGFLQLFHGPVIGDRFFWSVPHKNSIEGFWNQFKNLQCIATTNKPLKIALLGMLPEFEF